MEIYYDIVDRYDPDMMSCIPSKQEALRMLKQEHTTSWQMGDAYIVKVVRTRCRQETYSSPVKKGR